METTILLARNMEIAATNKDQPQQQPIKEEDNEPHSQTPTTAALTIAVPKGFTSLVDLKAR